MSINKATRNTIIFLAAGLLLLLFIGYVKKHTISVYNYHLSHADVVDKVKSHSIEGKFLLEKLHQGDFSIDYRRDVMPKFSASKTLLERSYQRVSEVDSIDQPDDYATHVLLKKSLYAAEQLIEQATMSLQTHSEEISVAEEPAIEEEVIVVEEAPTPPDSAANTDDMMDLLPSDEMVPADNSVDAFVEEEIEATPVFETVAVTEPAKQPAESLSEEAKIQFGIIYKELFGHLDNLSAHLKLQADASQAKVNFLFWLSIGAFMVVLSVLGVFMYRSEQRTEETARRSESKLLQESERVKKLTAFVESVSSGNYDMELETDGENDHLNATLLHMRNTLRENAESDRKRNWANTGLAQIGDILRSTTDTSGELFDKVIQFVVKYTNSNQGGIFVVNSENERDAYLELMACYAYERKKFLTKQIRPGEGVVGQCYLEGEYVYIEEVPSDYVSITSSLGKANPSSLLVVPMKVNDTIYGVLELASFKRFEEYEITFIQKLADNIAAIISSVRVNETTKVLLSQTQQQSELMKAQEEMIRQNMEELEATQEEMTRKQKALEDELRQTKLQAEEYMVKEKTLRDSQDMLQTIIDNIPRAIFWKDKNLTFKGCNKIFATLGGLKSTTDVVGLTDFDMPWRDQAEAYRQDDAHVMKHKEAKLNIVEENTNMDGVRSWVRVSKVPVTNKEGEVIAILGMFEDITAERLAAAEIDQKLAERKEAMEEVERLKKLLEK